MRKFSSISKNNNITNITIGKFDSIHLAHKALIDCLDSNGAVLIITSKKNKSPKNNGEILPQRQKKRFINKPIFFIKFQKIKDLSGESFLKYLQKKLPKLRKIIVGEDFCFGKNRSTKAAQIPKISPLKVKIIKEIKIDNIPIHSQNIRDFIQNREMPLANKLLGREYSIKGRIIRGQGIGSKKLVSTINIKSKKYLLPQNGVYASRLRLKNRLYPSVTFIGNRVSLDNSFAIESHILGSFSLKRSEILHKKIEIFFIEKIRENRQFSNLDSLKKQISSDIKQANKVLKK